MNLWAWLFNWKAAPLDPILSYSEPWIMQCDGEVYAIEAGQMSFGWPDEIAFCDAPEGPKRSA